MTRELEAFNLYYKLAGAISDFQNALTGANAEYLAKLREDVLMGGDVTVQTSDGIKTLDVSSLTGLRGKYQPTEAYNSEGDVTSLMGDVMRAVTIQKDRLFRNDVKSS